MAKKRLRKRVFPIITFEDIKRLNSLIPERRFESPSARSDKLAKAYLQKLFGVDWCDEHITASKRDNFLSENESTELLRETRRMRRILLMEMLYNLRPIKGFHSCLEEMAGGQIESTYAALEIGRMLVTMAVDRGIKFRFVTRSKISRRDYDLSLEFSDGVRVRAETKCKQEETKITLRTIEASLSQAKSQLPERPPGIIFVKVPRFWLDDEEFVLEMRKLAQRFLARSPSIVSVKYYTAVVIRQVDLEGETLGEIVSFREETNDDHKFGKLKDRNWHMFPQTGPVVPPASVNYNGMPANWQRLFVVRGDRI
jgi:hypothetical protein